MRVEERPGMKKYRFKLGIVAFVATVLTTAGTFMGAAADSPDRIARREFLSKATVALKAIQAGVKDDKILGPLKKASIEHGDGYVTVCTDTPESWPNFPTKSPTPIPPVRGFGSLSVTADADHPQDELWTPCIPPKGCFAGHTTLLVANTNSKIVVSTTTSDPKAQRRLVTLIQKELSNVGILARPEDPAEVDSVTDTTPPPESAPRQPGRPQLVPR